MYGNFVFKFVTLSALWPSKIICDWHLARWAFWVAWNALVLADSPLSHFHRKNHQKIAVILNCPLFVVVNCLSLLHSFFPPAVLPERPSHLYHYHHCCSQLQKCCCYCLMNGLLSWTIHCFSCHWANFHLAFPFTNFIGFCLEFPFVRPFSILRLEQGDYFTCFDSC